MRSVFFLQLIAAIISFGSFAQSTNEVMGGYNQIIDISEFHGGQFRVSVYARAEYAGINISRAHVFASIRTPGGFTKNVQVTGNQWQEYVIEGSIDQKSDKLVFGAFYYGIGKYYFDDYRVEARKGNGEWKNLSVDNGSFENTEIETPSHLNVSGNKWAFGQDEGFVHQIITDQPQAGKHALMIDGSSKTEFGKYMDIRGVKIYYEFHGHGTDTILLLHGNGQLIQSFNKQLPEFKKNYTILAMDSRAQGYSSDDGSVITYEQMAEDVFELLTKLKIKRINILGWSDGGNTGLILAMKHPEKVKKLATMGANLYCDKTSVDEKTILALQAKKKELEDKGTPESDYQLRMTNLLLNEPKIDPDDLKHITCPVLVMAGSDDVIKSGHTRLIARKIKKSTLVIFKGGSHYEPELNPARFNKTVLDFFGK